MKTNRVSNLETKLISLKEENESLTELVESRRDRVAHIGSLHKINSENLAQEFSTKSERVVQLQTKLQPLQDENQRLNDLIESRKDHVSKIKDQVFKVKQEWRQTSGKFEDLVDMKCERIDTL